MSHSSYTPVPDAQDVKENKVMAILAYVLFFLPLIICPKSQFARFHANQGLLLFITSFVIGLAAKIVPWVGSLIIGPLGGLACLALFLFGVVAAARGELKPLPLIGEIKLIQ